MQKITEIIEQLKQETTENATIKDLSNLELALKISDAKIRANILNDEYKNHPSTIELIQNIDEKINKISQKITEMVQRIIELEQKGFKTIEEAKTISLDAADSPINKTIELEQKINKLEGLNSITELLSKIRYDIKKLNFELTSLIAIKQDIKNENKEKITTFLDIPKYDTEQERLIQRCIESLAVGYFSFPTYFGKPIAKPIIQWHEYEFYEETVNKIYEILSNKQLIEDLKKNMEIKYKEDKLKEEIVTLETILNNKNTLKLCITLLDEREELQDKYTTHYIDGITFEQKYELSTKINEINKLLNEITTQKIWPDDIDIFSREAFIIKNKALINMSEQELKSHLIDTKAKRENVIADYKYDLEETKKLMTEDYQSCINILCLLSAPERYELTPIICLYILKLLIDSKESREISPYSKYTEEYQQASNQIIIDINNYYREKIEQITTPDMTTENHQEQVKENLEQETNQLSSIKSRVLSRLKRKRLS